ncbi:MAG TPA: hypothetical protein VK171_15535 [Fimbriimonas sp.]|nr:hypothetical protein [Fimbriimonas sp.]
MGEDLIQIGGIEATIKWLMTPIGLLIDEVRVTGGSHKIDPDAIKSTEFDLDFEATIFQKSIEVYLNKLEPAGLKDFVVNVKEDGLHIQATKTVILPIAAKVHAKLLLTDNQSISVQVLNAEAMGAGLKNMVASQIEQHNPIVTADLFPMAVTFDSLVHTDGAVKVVGTAKR